MDAATTSLAPANSTRGEWRQFAAFLKRPMLPERAPMPRLSSLVAVLRLFLLDLLVMSLLLALAGLVMAAGIDMPETALAGVEIGAGIVFAVVVVAPLAEELGFRGWLSGRPGHLLAVVALGLALLVAAQIASPGGTMVLAAVALLAGLVGATLAIVLARRRDALRLFRKWFPGFFWLSTAGFSLVHLSNFQADQMAMALPLVLPQFVTGSMLGYLRVTYGLWASMLMHMLHNGTFIALVLLAGRAG